MLLIEMPAARAHDQHGALGFRFQRIVLAVGGGEFERAGDRALHRTLPFDHVGPRGRRRILEVRHVALRAGVERVDDHLGIDRAGDLDAAVGQRGGDRGDAPVAGADIGGVGAEVRQRASIETGLAGGAGLEAHLALAVKAAMQAQQEGLRLRGQDGILPGRLAGDFEGVLGFEDRGHPMCAPIDCCGAQHPVADVYLTN